MTASTPFEQQEDDPIQRAGDQGEEWLYSVLGTYSKSRKGQLFVGKRVPTGSGRREIDLIAATTKRLYIFEAKNWSGAVSLQGNSWVQIRRNGERIEHENPLDATREQVQALFVYLKQKGIVIPEGYVSHKVFLVNPHLTLDAAIARHRDVLYRSKLSHPINHETIIDYCLAQEQRDPGPSGQRDAEMRTLYSEIVDEVSQLRTWDRIFLNGATIWKGDVKQITAGTEVLVPDELLPGTTFEVQWSGDEKSRLLQELLGFTSGTLVFAEGGTFPIRSDDTILFQGVRQQTPSRLPLTRIRKITIG